MSQNPFEYTQYLGQHTQTSYPYASPPSIQPAASYYASPQDPSQMTVAGNYAALNGSFEYNSSRIPGLGMGGVAATPRPPPLYKSDSVYSQPHGVTASGASSPVATLQSQEHSVIGLQQQTHPSNGRNAIPASPTVRSNEPSEEGELSEGEFEDLYEPKVVNDQQSQVKHAMQASAAATDELPGSIGDADGSSIYDTTSTPQEEVVQDSTSASLPAVDDEEYEPGESEPEYQPREHSGSYSPHLSPTEARHEESAQSKVDLIRIREPSPPHHQPFSTFASEYSTKPTADMEISSNKRPSLDQSQATSAVNVSNPPAASIAQSRPYKSVSEAKIKAQQAILGLWPLKVRYQNYLDEGLDPQIVKSLFTQLGLDTSLPKPAPSTTPVTENGAAPPTESESVPQSSPKPATGSSTVPQTVQPTPNKTATEEPKMADKKSAQEERKDKIARMLAAKKNKSAAAPAPAPAPAPASATIAASPAAAADQSNTPALATLDPSDEVKAKIRAEKNQKIMEKLAALKKQREEKPANAKQVTTSLSSETTQDAGLQALEPTATANEAVVNAPTGDKAASSTPQANLEISIPPSPQPNAKNRNLKRPVASDFDAYPSNGSALKRTRTQETLIIDVSDDEDVEMDLGSPTDAPASAIQNNGGLTKQNSLAAFPPLTGSRTWRGQKSTPATPGGGTPLAEHGQKLDFLTQQIEEAKRKIAEKEAKKATKRPSGLSTPVPQSPAPVVGQTEPARLPKLSDASQSPKVERRARIASYDLPVVEAALRDKRERLQRLQAEAAQLELEVEAEMAERQKLAAEMETLDSVAESESAKPNGQLTNVQSDSVPAQQETASVVDDGVLSSPQSNSLEAPGANAESTMIEDEVASIETFPIPVLGGDTIETTAVDTQADPDPTPSSEEISDPIITAMEPIVDEAVPSASGDVLAQDMDAHVSPATTPIPSVAEDTKDVGEDVAPDADVPMQISDAEDEDSYEPFPAQISSTDKVHVANGATEEIPDEEPFEPSPAQILGPNVEAVPELATSEVQLRPSEEHRLLMREQTESQSSVSAQDVLSYQSPLRYFLAYRFHPSFLESVSGGFKSMTYSFNIDPQRPMCPFLTDGGQCPHGDNCEFQHFEKMTLPETAIIAELGSTETYEGEEKARFIEGLKKVLQGLKANKVKDFGSITKAIVQYRADFLGDRSKVLPLKGVAI